MSNSNGDFANSHNDADAPISEDITPDQFMNEDEQEKPGKTVKCQHGGRREAIVELILEDIIQSLLSENDRLVTQKLSERYGVSHTPIREALITLSGIGLISLEPNRGAIVRSITEKYVREICDFRSILEKEAVKLACGNISQIQLYSMRERIERLIDVSEGMGVPAYEDARLLDNELHDLIANSCGNSFLCREIHRLKVLFRTFRNVGIKMDQAKYDHRKMVKDSQEHLAITNALIQDDRKDAVKQMGQHVEGAYKHWIQTLAKVHAKKADHQSKQPEA